MAQLGAQRQQHIKHHAHTGQRLAFKAASRLVRVDDHIGIGQHNGARQHGRQVVVGHQHLHAQRLGTRHALQAGNAVVHRHQHVSACGFHAFCNAGRQAVAIDHAVGHQVSHGRKVQRRTQQPEPAHAHRAGCGAVAVVVGHDADLAARRHGVGQQHGGLGRAMQGRRRQQTRQAVVQLVGAEHAACGKQLRQQRVHTGLLQGPNTARRRVSDGDFHKFSR